MQARGNQAGCPTVVDHSVRHEGDPALFWDPIVVGQHVRLAPLGKTARETGWNQPKA